MQLTSPVFVHQGSIPQRYTCQGEGINPPLVIADVPQAAKSLALIVDDPDAPVGLYTHWIMWHIDPSIKTIEENSIPKGAMEGVNSSGSLGWTPPCPPKDTGIHHYRFMLSALSKDLDIEEGVARDDLSNAMKDCVIDKTELVGMYTSEKDHPENPTELL